MSIHLPAATVPDSPLLSQRVNRRVAIKAAAILGAISGMGGLSAIMEQRNASAQAAPETLTATWVESEEIATAITSDDGGTIYFQSDFPISAIGASWNGDTGTWPVVQVQLSADGETFSTPVVLEPHDDGGPPSRDSRIFTTLLCDGAATWVAYRMTDQNGDSSVVDGFQFHWFNTSDGPSLETMPTVGMATDDPAAPPATIARSDWGADESLRFDDGEEIWAPWWKKVEHVIIHHTETSNVQDPLEAMRSIYYYHAVTRGWGDIGYNYLIDRLGNIYEGRTGGQDVVGGHAFEYAVGSSGVGLIGNFSFSDVNAATQASTVALVAWLTRDLDPLGTGDFWSKAALPTICGHRDVNDTTCPGDLAYDDLATIRNLVALANEIPANGPPAGLIAGDVVMAAAGGVNLRANAGTSAPLVAELPGYSTGIVIDGPEAANDYQWYRITTDYGIGWAAATFLGIAPAGAESAGRYSPGSVVATTSEARLRKEPGIDAAVVINLPTGSVAEIMAGPENAGEYRWYQMHTATHTGWFASAFLAPSNKPAPPQPPKPPDPPSGGIKIGDAIKVATDDGGGLNLRSSPGTTSAIVAVLANGTKGEVVDGPSTASGRSWFKITTPKGTGWAASEFLAFNESPTPDDKFSAGDRVIVDTGNGGLNLRVSPGTGSVIVTVLPDGTPATVLDGPAAANGYAWYQVQTGSKSGWAAGEFLSLDDGFAAGAKIVVATDDGGPLNLRAEPSTSASVIKVMPDGTKGAVLEGPQTGGDYTWYRIDTSYGRGWAVALYLQSA